jgi:phosphatidate cytidylyltransferase
MRRDIESQLRARKAQLRATGDQTRAQLRATREQTRDQLKATRAQIEATNQRITKRAGRNLPLAIGAGLVLGFAMLFSLIVVEELFMVVGGVLLGFCAVELATAMRQGGRDVPRLPAVLGVLVMLPIGFYLGASGVWLGTLAVGAVLVVWRLVEVLPKRNRVSPAFLLRDLGAALFIQIYLGTLGGLAFVLTAADDGEGRWWVLAFILLNIAVDVAAWASGVLFGKHKMAPRISPSKTWEGFAGSMVAALAAGILFAVLLLDQAWWVGVVFGLLIGLSGTAGDLIESLIKRDLGVKDISSWLPGHGGFLDRLDSIIPSAAVTYVLFLLFS